VNSATLHVALHCSYIFLFLFFFSFYCIFTGKKDDLCVSLSHARRPCLFLLLSSSSPSLVGDGFKELGLEAIEKGDERDWARGS
jgi:hypothetical protein